MWGRIRQTIQALSSWLRPVADSQAAAYLSDAEYQLFLSMPRSERQHHLRVLNYLLKRGQNHPALCVAALLHDVGKTRVRFTIPERILVVMVRQLLPGYFRRWSQGEPVGWRKAFVVSEKHPAWSAEMVEPLHTMPLAVRLIRHHQDQLDTFTADDEFIRLLKQLRAADDAS